MIFSSPRLTRMPGWVRPDDPRFPQVFAYRQRRGEFAIVVADAWQAHGIATHLMQALMKHAAGRGIRRMEGFVMASNAKMLEFMRFLGFEIRSSAKGPQSKLVSRPLDDMATT